MLDEDGLKSFHSAHNNSRDMDEDDDNDNDNDEDHTARLNRQTSTRGASESALQRVKSLAQRNKMVSLLMSCMIVWISYNVCVGTRQTGVLLAQHPLPLWSDSWSPQQRSTNPRLL